MFIYFLSIPDTLEFPTATFLGVDIYNCIRNSLNATQDYFHHTTPSEKNILKSLNCNGQCTKNH